MLHFRFSIWSLNAPQKQLCFFFKSRGLLVTETQEPWQNSNWLEAFSVSFFFFFFFFSSSLRWDWGITCHHWAVQFSREVEPLPPSHQHQQQHCLLGLRTHHRPLWSNFHTDSDADLAAFTAGRSAPHFSLPTPSFFWTRPIDVTEATEVGLCSEEPPKVLN